MPFGPGWAAESQRFNEVSFGAGRARVSPLAEFSPVRPLGTLLMAMVGREESALLVNPETPVVLLALLNPANRSVAARTSGSTRTDCS